MTTYPSRVVAPPTLRVLTVFTSLLGMKTLCSARPALSVFTSHLGVSSAQRYKV